MSEQLITRRFAIAVEPEVFEQYPTTLGFVCRKGDVIARFVASRVLSDGRAWPLIINLEMDSHDSPFGLYAQFGTNNVQYPMYMYKEVSASVCYTPTQFKELMQDASACGLVLNYPEII